MTAEMLCDCKHRKWGHAGGTYACWDCGCKRYTPDIQQAARDHAEHESTFFRLRRVEQERDELAVRLEYVRGDKDSFLAQRNNLIHVVQELTAELASARAELERLRATRQEATDA